MSNFHRYARLTYAKAANPNEKITHEYLAFTMTSANLPNLIPLVPKYKNRIPIDRKAKNCMIFKIFFFTRIIMEINWFCSIYKKIHARPRENLFMNASID
jgi:hypothetical protein